MGKVRVVKDHYISDRYCSTPEAYMNYVDIYIFGHIFVTFELLNITFIVKIWFES